MKDQAAFLAGKRYGTMENGTSSASRLKQGPPFKEKWKARVQEILSPADIRLDGSRPWDIQVLDSRWYFRVLTGGSLALGESYMDGWWECGALDQFFHRLWRAGLTGYGSGGIRAYLGRIASRFLNRQSRRKAFEVGERHYDAGNDLFQAMLDRRMTYTCGYWESTGDLDAAQEAKLELVCRKLGLKAGQKVLDIGCGWGSFLKYACGKYGAQGVGITVSQEQAEWGRELCRGLPIEIRLQDYRDLKGRFDHVVSLGMFEHVGFKNYRTYMEAAHRCLREGGLFLLHTMGNNQSVERCDPWFDRYIFPNGMIPSIRQLGGALEGLFTMEDWHNFGAYYDKTLMAWFGNFHRSWNRIGERYGDRFYRMWKYYLLCLAGSFRARALQVWQLVLSKGGVPGGYRPRRWRQAPDRRGTLETRRFAEIPA